MTDGNNVRRILFRHLEFILVIALTGCAATENPNPVSTNSASGAASVTPKLTSAQRTSAEEDARNEILFQYHDAAVAIRSGRYADAKALLDSALLTLGGIYGKDRNAKKARSHFSTEAKKTFIGKPYERIMANYYRAILYWMDGELDNARACFRTGQVEDGSTEEAYSGDYVLLDYLDGLVTTKLGDDGSDSYNRAAKSWVNSEMPPPYDSQANALFFVEFGSGPTKFSTGQYREELRFRVPDASVISAMLRIDAQTIRLSPYDDLGFQATTRGGRVMDHILANKAVFKSTTETVSNAAIVGGVVAALASGDKTVQQVGLGVAVVGGVLEIISGATKPEADVRAWDNLPRYLAFSALRLTPGQHTATIEFLGKDGQPFPKFSKSVSVSMREGAQDTIVFLSDRSNDGPLPQFTEAEPATIAQRVQTSAASFVRMVPQGDSELLILRGPTMGISDTLIFRARTDLSKAQQALRRSVGVSWPKWRIMTEATVDEGTLMVQMCENFSLGQSRRGWVQLSQIADNDVEIRAKLTTFPDTNGGLADPQVHGIVKQVQDAACSNFKANLEKMLGTALRTVMDQTHK